MEAINEPFTIPLVPDCSSLFVHASLSSTPPDSCPGFPILPVPDDDPRFAPLVPRSPVSCPGFPILPVPDDDPRLAPLVPRSPVSCPGFPILPAPDHCLNKVCYIRYRPVLVLLLGPNHTRYINAGSYCTTSDRLLTGTSLIYPAQRNHRLLQVDGFLCHQCSSDTLCCVFYSNVTQGQKLNTTKSGPSTDRCGGQ